MGRRVHWRRINIISGYFCFATGQPIPQALSSNRCSMPAASILSSRTRHSLTSSHYCKRCITFSIVLLCCSKYGKNSFWIVLYQYIRRYLLISKNGQSELCRNNLSFSKLYLQRKLFLVTFVWHVHFFSHWWGQAKQVHG